MKLEVSALKQMRPDGNSQFVLPQVYLELATSTKKLERSDDAAASLRGLLDPETGKRYLVEENMLRHFEAGRKNCHATRP